LPVYLWRVRRAFLRSGKAAAAAFLLFAKGKTEMPVTSITPRLRAEGGDSSPLTAIGILPRRTDYHHVLVTTGSRRRDSRLARRGSRQPVGRLEDQEAAGL